MPRRKKVHVHGKGISKSQLVEILMRVCGWGKRKAERFVEARICAGPQCKYALFVSFDREELRCWPCISQGGDLHFVGTCCRRRPTGTKVVSVLEKIEYHIKKWADRKQHLPPRRPSRRPRTEPVRRSLARTF